MDGNLENLRYVNTSLLMLTNLWFSRGHLVGEVDDVFSELLDCLLKLLVGSFVFPVQHLLRFDKPPHLSTRWSTTLSAKVNLLHEINFRTLYGAILVT